MENNIRVLVTGSSGLIGRWVCDRLNARGICVLGLDVRPQPPGTGTWRSVICDLLNLNDLQVLMTEFQPTHVLHLAARTDLNGQSLEEYAINIDGVENLIQAISQISTVTRAVYTSSQLVCKVGHVPKHMQEYNPDTIYGRSKVETERIVRLNDGGGVSWCLTRPTTVWGPYMSDHYASFLEYVKKGLYFHSGSDNILKSYAYAGNIAFQYDQLLFSDHERIHGNVFYLADYTPISLKDYVNALANEMSAPNPITLPLSFAKFLAWCGDAFNACGGSFPFNSFRLRNIRTEYVFDTRPAEAVCGQLPYDFQTGIRDTIAWYKSQIDMTP